MMWNGFLNSVFNIASGLLNNQAQVIQAFFEGRDCLHLLRTGGGKSITFQLPSLLEPEMLVLVISPISALIREQVIKLQGLGVKAALLGNDTDGDVAQMDDVQILYMNPECLFNGLEVTKNMERLKDRHQNNIKRVSLIAIDEAHKVFEWQNFRPAYAAVMGLKKHFPSVPIHMHTATMTKEMQAASVSSVLTDPVILKFSTNRPNIYYRILSYSPPTLTTQPDGSVGENWRAAAKAVIKETNDESALVYTSTAKSATALTTSFLELNKRAAFYKGRAHQSVSEREIVQDSHLSGDLQYLCATSAYGVGIENPTETNVFTIGMPTTCIEFIQQAGRVGRRGQPSIATLMVAPYKDIQKLQYLETAARQRHPDSNGVDAKAEIKKLHLELGKVFQLSCLPFSGKCLRSFMMAEMDDTTAAEFSHPLGCCDSCTIKEFCSTCTEDSYNVQPFLLACSELNDLGVFSVTSTKIINYLKGKIEKVVSRNEVLLKAFNNQRRQLKAFSAEKDGLSVAQLNVVFKQCVANGWLISDFYNYRVTHNRGQTLTTVHIVTLSETGMDVLSQTSMNTHVYNPKRVLEALDFIRKKESDFFGVAVDDTISKGEGNRVHAAPIKNFKQPQRIVEALLKKSSISIVTKDQFIFLGYKHQCNKLLYADNITEVPGFPGDDEDFIWKDVTLSKKSALKPITKKVQVMTNEKMVATELIFFKNPCGGVKKCSRCDFVCSRKHMINTCPRHGELADLDRGGEECPGFFAYVKPSDSDDKRRWLGFLNGPHNHNCPPISKPTTLLEAQVKTAMTRDPSLQTADLQKGHGLDCMPMAISLAAANPMIMGNLRRKCMKTMGEVTDSTLMTHFDDTAKKTIDTKDEAQLSSSDKLQVLEYTTPYFRDLVTHNLFEAGIFMTPFMMKVMSEGEFFECDVTFPGVDTVKYLLNLCTFNAVSLRYDVVGRVLMNSVTSIAYRLVFSRVFELVTEKYPSFMNGQEIRGITVDFSLAQAKGLDEALDGTGMEKIKGCRSVHYMRNVDKVIAKVCQNDGEKQLFKKICKLIRECPSREAVSVLFNCLDGTSSLDELSEDVKCEFTTAERELDVFHWKAAKSWVKWWSGDRVRVMLCEAYRTMSDADWLAACNHTNHVEALNRVSVASKQRTSLSTQLQHIYREDKKRVYQQIADSTGCFREKRGNAQPRPQSITQSAELLGRYVMSSKVVTEPKPKKKKRVSKKPDGPKAYHLAKITSYNDQTELYTVTLEGSGETFTIPLNICDDPDIQLMPVDYRPPQ